MVTEPVQQLISAMTEMNVTAIQFIAGAEKKLLLLLHLWLQQLKCLIYDIWWL